MDTKTKRAFLKKIRKLKSENQGVQLNRSEMAFLRKIGIPYENIYGAYNGFGYPVEGKQLIYDQKRINKVLSNLKTLKTKKPSVRRALTPLQKDKQWIKRFAKLSGASKRESRRISIQKNIAHYDSISEMQYKNSLSPSRMREKLIRKMERTNPLRRVRDSSHAENILAAHRRHKYSDYDHLLEEARNLGYKGQEVKDYAHKKKTYSSSGKLKKQRYYNPYKGLHKKRKTLIRLLKKLK